MLVLSVHLFYKGLVHESLKCSILIPTKNIKQIFQKLAKYG